MRGWHALARRSPLYAYLLRALPGPTCGLGRDAGAIEAVLGATGVPMARHADLAAATAWCFEQARDGDVVACTKAHATAGRSVSVGPGGDTIATGGGDALVRLWRVERP